MRRWLLPALAVLMLAPVPVAGWLGGRGIDDLLRRERDLRAEETVQRLVQDLERAAGPRLSGGSRTAWTSRPPRLILDAAERGRHRVATEPAGDELVHPALLRSRALQEQGRGAEALEAVNPVLRVEEEALQAAAWLRVAELFRAEGVGARVSEALARAAEGEAGGVWQRALALLQEPPEDQPAALEDWVTELEARPTTLQELAWLGRALAWLAESRDVSSIHGRLRRRREQDARVQRIVRHLDQRALTPPALVHVADTWVLVSTAPVNIHDPDKSGSPTVAWELDGVQSWLDDWGPDQERLLDLVQGARPEGSTWILPLGEGPARRGTHLQVDLSGAGLALQEPMAGARGLFGPRGLMWAGLLVYSMAAVLLLRTLHAQRRRSEQLLEAREDLIARVLHEVRTPLTVLRMYAETLEMGRVPEESRTEYLETIGREARRLGQLVDGVAAMAREGSRDPGAQAAPALADLPVQDLATLVEEVAGLFRLEMQKGGGDLQVRRIREGDVLSVRAESEDLRRILEVVLDNALAYCPAPVRVAIDVARNTDLVTVQVRDNGPGIPEAERSTVLERWRRGSTGQQSGRRGAGMGLALARQTARRLGGDLTLDNGPEGGTVVRVTLPLVHEATGP